jgi:hypothetical protein
MKADISRLTFQLKKHYHQVIRQQGRVDVDADWNEQQTILNHRIETEANDVIGQSGAPMHDPGFHIVKAMTDFSAEEQGLPGNKITPPTPPPKPGAGDFLISAGRYYVDGILCENEQLVLFSAQPNLPGQTQRLPDLLKKAGAGFGIVYLDAWLRHITALDDDLIREKALGGPDTATRSQVVWQVKVLPWKIKRPDGTRAIPPACDAAFTQLLSQLVPTNVGTLNARTQPVPPDQGLCSLPPSAGYQSLENQLYRVEIHHGSDDPNGPTFKWSRDNGSVVTGITSVSGNNVVVLDVGPDDVLGFASGQWVEIVDDASDLGGVPGSLFQIDAVDKTGLTISLKTTPPTVDPTLHPKLRRWDQTSATDLSAGVPVATGWLPLEDGIQVQFPGGTYRTGDYWLIPARTATGDIEWPPYALPNTNPQAQPPRGIKHHYSCLGLVQLDGKGGLNVIQDCRKLFPPLTEITAAAPPAIHVQSISWINNAALPGSALKGISLMLDAAPDPASISDATVIVELEAPLTFFNLSFGLPQNTPAPEVPDVKLVLKGTTSLVAGANGQTISWMPNAASQTVITEIIRHRARGRVRVTLIGSAIWSGDGTARRHLDGRAFADPQLAPGLVLPSGSGAAWSDFESWFYVGAQPAG